MITKLSTDYLLIASALAEFYRYANGKDDELKFYLMCKFFYYYTKITEEEGGFEPLVTFGVCGLENRII